MDAIAALESRGLVHQSTDIAGLTEHLKEPRKVYCGFDPTAPSLTIGNLVPIVILSHLQRAGHTPVVVMGGATGLIGDPSGKSAERQLLDLETVEANINSQRQIFESILDFDPNSPNRAILLNNADWLCKLSFVEALRDIGKYFSVNQMIQRDSVRERLVREQGISYTEFSYMLLQAWDFEHLYEQHGVTVELGGSDQWGNIVPGVDLVRRTCQRQVFGLTCPLVTRADGGKFGKTETGPVWLSSDRTSPYALYQFFMNTADSDVGRYLRMFSLVPLSEVGELERALITDSAGRIAQRRLAREVTARVHGEPAAADAETAANALFAGDITVLSPSVLRDVMDGVPTAHFSLETFPLEGIPAVDLLCSTGACSSRREAREMLAAGAITLNGRRVEATESLNRGALLHGHVAAIRRGRRSWFFGVWD